MKRKKIIALVSMVLISVSVVMVGCGNSNKEVINKNVTVSKENVGVKSDLKIASSDEVVFESPLIDKQYAIKYDGEGELLVEQIEADVDPDLSTYGSMQIENNKAKLQYANSIRFENITNGKIQFLVERISDDKVKIRNYISEEGFEIDRSLIANGNNRYTLLDGILFEYVINDDSTISNIIWSDLNNNTNGTIEIPSEYKGVSEANVMGDKIALSVVINEDSAVYPSKILIFDMKTSEVEEKEIGTFGFMLPIDDEKAMIISSAGEGTSLDMYNIKTSEKKQLFEYAAYDYEDSESINISYVGLFPNKDKIYYCEYTNEKAYIKAAKINGMGIEKPITLCELNIEEEYISEPPKVIISEDGTEVIVYYNNSMVGGIEKFFKIKLNK